MDLQGVSPIGQQVARYRKAAKISAEDLAQKAGEGLTRSVIANLENGRKDDVTVKQLMALSAALHVPPALLLADVFDPGQPSPYPLPEQTVGPDEDEYDNNASLLGWIGGHTFRSAYSAQNPATRLAYDAFRAVRAYLNSMGRLSSLASRFATADEEDKRDGLYAEAIQHAAENTLETIETMERAGIRLSGAAVAKVHRLLANAGLKYEPIQYPDFDFPEIDG